MNEDKYDEKGKSLMMEKEIIFKDQDIISIQKGERPYKSTISLPYIDFHECSILSVFIMLLAVTMHVNLLSVIP